MDHFLTYVANDTEQNANDILDEMMLDNNSFGELRNIISEPGIANISIAAMEHSQPKQEQVIVMLLWRLRRVVRVAKKKSLTYSESTSNAATSGKPWTKNKRDTSGSYVENIKRRQTTFCRKIKILHQKAEMISKQTGAQIKIIVYNPDNGKTSNFYTSNTQFNTSQEAIYQKMSQSIHHQRYHPVAIIRLSRVSHQQSISITIIQQ